MVILIGGASHTGKTTLAQYLLQRYFYPYLSVDHLKMGLIRSGQTALTPESSDRVLTDYLWPIVSEIVKTVIENAQNLIVEGCYIPFDWAKSFSTDYLREIRCICLIFSADYIRSHWDDINRYADVTEKRREDCDISQDALIRENAEILEECRRYGNDYILVEDSYKDAFSSWRRSFLHQKNPADARLFAGFPVSEE